MSTAVPLSRHGQRIRGDGAWRPHEASRSGQHRQAELLVTAAACPDLSAALSTARAAKMFERVWFPFADEMLFAPRPEGGLR